jgi:hypothetical protein
MKKGSRSRLTLSGHLMASVGRVLHDFVHRGRALVVATLLLAALLAVGSLAWRSWSRSLGSRDEYRITADRIRLTPPPAWLKANVAAQALEDSGLSGSLSLIDAKLLSRLVEALELHPWIDRVTRVEKRYPALVIADVTYRLPFAAAESRGDDRVMLCPVDAAGVRLPASDVPTDILVRLPRIVEAAQLPLVGQAFEGPSMAGALELIAFFSDQWEALSFWTVAPLEQPEAHGKQKYILYDVLTSGGTRVHWGAAPGASPADESSAQQKLARLKDYLEANQVDLKSIDSPALIDVRRDLQVRPRMAALPTELVE